MDFYAYVWGVVKYVLPIMIFIIAVAVSPNILLIIISVIWITSSITVSVLSMEPSGKRNRPS
ncbi:MAG: hypothetical protein M1402_03720 [Candidatus Thermoplasmatota archaeon]|jgi:hypothetical protein|nr:hypothetical protein [Candidatus Thermoplasmatota archaeon]MCL5665243.1 hypothetical protein [Candidatus Thermoplasmatota archaeon]